MSAKLKARLKKLLAREKGAVVWEWGARFPVAMVYPNIYPVAMGNLRFHAIYHLVNGQPNLECERAFLPDPEEWQEYVRTKTPILTLQSQRPLRDFAAVAFSISFEPDYQKVLDVLAQSGIPLLAAHRGPTDPLVLADGVATFLNPEPLLEVGEPRFLPAPSTRTGQATHCVALLLPVDRVTSARPATCARLVCRPVPAATGAYP